MSMHDVLDDGAPHEAWEWDEELPSGPSKTQLKHERIALQQLAEKLAKLPAAQRDMLNLDAALQEAIKETPRIQDKRAIPRHWKRIANLLINGDPDQLERVREHIDHAGERQQQRTYLVDFWRTRLINEGDQALQALLESYPAAPRQELRMLIRAAKKEQGTDSPKNSAYRKLYRQLDGLLDSN